jgi:putative endonuclease
MTIKRRVAITMKKRTRTPPLCHCEERQRRGNLETSSASSYNIAMNKQFYVYIMTNNRNTVLYIGVTDDLKRRVYEHKEKLANGFTKKYNVTKLVYYEVCEEAEGAIFREKQLKAGARQRKVELVNGMNREWRDLYEEL